MNWKKLMGIFTAVLMAGLVYGQSPITTISSIDRIGTPDAVDAGYFRVYNTGGTADVSHVTIVSDSTNLFTVSPASSVISNNLAQVTVTFATGLAVGNYSGNIVVTQTNAPVTVRTIPVTLRVSKDTGNRLGSARVDYMTPRIDVNATTDPTDYTPRYKGDMLVGQAGAGTGAVWVATGLTTSDWSRIE